LKRGELYLVRKPGSHDTRKEDPRKQRVFVLASRQTLIDSRFSQVICVPVYSQHDGLATQVLIGIDEGLKRESSIHCDELASLSKSLLTHYIGSLSPAALRKFDDALTISLGLQPQPF
jgi:mRNA interferase MazF